MPPKTSRAPSKENEVKHTPEKKQSQVKKRNFLQKFVDRIDLLQQSHPVTSVLFGVVKKYGDDGGNHLAALITYYGFLSLFPLLIVATASIQLIAQENEQIRSTLLNSITSYFPAIGQNLATSLQAPSKTGLAMAVGLLLALYGAKGVADALQNAIHTVWGTPRRKRAGFPLSMAKSLSIIFGGGAGLLVSAVLTGYATGSDFSFFTKVFIGTMGFLTLFSVFWGVFTFGSSARRRPIANIPGALISALGLLFLQSIGSYLIQNQLSRHSGLNAQFGVVLVLLFWIYLQAQVVLYALEYNTVRAHKLYPRAIDTDNPTEADERAYELYAARDNYQNPEDIRK